MKVEELLAQLGVRLHWCKAIKASWEWLLITEGFFKEVLSQKYSSFYTFICMFMYIYAPLTCIYLPQAVCSAAWPAPLAPGRLSSQIRLCHEPCSPQAGGEKVEPWWMEPLTLNTAKWETSNSTLRVAVFSSCISQVSCLSPLLTGTGSEHPPAIGAKAEPNLQVNAISHQANL